LRAEQLKIVAELESAGNTVGFIVQDAMPIGLIALRDTLRADAVAALSELLALYIETVLLTGDNPRAAAAIANELA
ncbi:HAD family hydrolase, partial [Erwinia sp. PsM31]|uniref:HAD family hydrolase n=1 Tax=Erwinia sp. PsM31 TaxID=3030535 RepID=UPI00263A4E21